MSQLRIKQGATFLLTLKIVDVNGTPVNTSACTMVSQLRTSLGAVVATLGITPTGTPGQAVILAHSEDTATWPPGILQGDISIVTGGATTLSDSFTLVIEKAVTQ